MNIKWAVADDSNVRVAIFNSAGEFVYDVWNAPVSGGVSYQATWDGRNYLGYRVSSNVYVIRLFAPAVLLVKSIAVVR